MRYYVIQVLSGSEVKVQKTFLKCYMPKFCSLHAEIILPRVNFVKHNDKSKSCLMESKALLPGYLILKCADLTDELYYLIKGITGVIRVFRINIYYEEVRNFILTYQEKLAVIKKRIEYVKNRAKAKGTLKVLFNKIMRKKRAVKVKFSKKRGCLATPRIIRLLN